jgi:hypothetical protein
MVVESAVSGLCAHARDENATLLAINPVKVRRSIMLVSDGNPA